MDSTTSNVPDTIRQEAKQRALKIIEQNPGCASYVRPEDLETQNLFVPVVSIIKPTAEEFHKFIPGIGILPKVPLMNTIAEKAGVNIHRTDTAKRSEYVWTGHSFGDKRMPDGTLRTDDASYEYDVQKRAELDFLKDSEKQPDERKYTSEIAKRKYILELCKFAEQKAVTGAQLALIHKLAKIPASFKTAEELTKGMIVCRVDRNVNGIMQDPNMRGAIIQHALGATTDVFGPKQIEAQPAESAPVPRTVDVESGEVLTPAADPVQADLFEDDVPWAESDAEMIVRIREQIRGMLNDPACAGSKAKGLAWLESSPDAKVLEKLQAKQKTIEGAIANYRARKSGAA